MAENQDLSGDKGVLKKILKEGVGNETPQAGCKVSLHYTGTLTDGTKFDSSVDRGTPFEFDLGAGSVIKAFDMGVSSMKLHEKCVLTCAPEYAYGKGGSPPTIPPNATLIFELELLGWKGEDLSPNSNGAIEKFIIKPSDTQSKRTPTDGALVKVHLKGTFDSKVFDERDVEFNLGEGSEQNIIEGVEIAIEKMKKSETARVIIKSEYAFGKTGNSEFNIPENATVEYTITLNEFEKEKEVWKLSEDECIEQAKLYKEKGTKYLKENKFKLANKMYDKATLYLSNSSDETKQVKIAVFLNIALVQQKLKDYWNVKTACNNALELDSNNVKALYRRGQSFLELGDIDKAIEDFTRVNELEPENKAAINQITICKHKLKEVNEKEKKIYAKMFEKFASADKQKEEEEKQNQIQDNLPIFGEWTPEEHQIRMEYNEKEAEYQKQKHNIIMLNEGNN